MDTRWDQRTGTALGAVVLAAAIAAAPPARGATAEPDLPQVGATLVMQTNALRRQAGRPGVQPDAALNAAAERFALVLALDDRYGHGVDGRTPAQRAEAAGYVHCTVLENLGFQQSSAGFGTDALAAGFLAGWQASPTHRRNLFDRDVTQTGVAVAYASQSGRYYAVQLFGRPAAAAVHFSLTNRTDQAMHYGLGGRRFVLAAHTRREHRECVTPVITFDARVHAAHRRVAVTDGAQYVLEPVAPRGVRLDIR